MHQAACTAPQKVLHHAAPLAADNTNTPVTFTVSDGAATAVAMTQQATSSDAREGSAMVPIKVSRGQRERVTRSESTTWRDKHQCTSCRNSSSSCSWLQQQVYHLNKIPPCAAHCRCSLLWCLCTALPRVSLLRSRASRRSLLPYRSGIGRKASSIQTMCAGRSFDTSSSTKPRGFLPRAAASTFPLHSRCCAATR